jgi:endoglucanase
MNRISRAALSVAALLLVAVLLGACSDNNAVNTADTAALNNSSNSNDAAKEGKPDTDTSDGEPADKGNNGEQAVFEGELAGDGKDVKVNQVGYLPDARKLAIVEGEGEAVGFRVIDTENRAIVFEGRSTESKLDTNAGERVRELDFSPVQAEGEYVIEADGAGISYPFRIGKNVYEASFVDAIRSYTLGRSGIAIDDPVTGLKHAAGHTQDAVAKLDIDHPDAKRGTAVDVSGGWYDAGDYGKYTTPGAISAAQLLLSYELNPEAYTDGQLQFPAGLSEGAGASMPDVLEEVKYELDWLLKMQRPDGAVYHKVSGLGWPGMIRPEDDTQDRYVFGMSTYGTGMYAGTLAMAARVYEPFDDAYAAKLLESAKTAQQYLERNPEVAFLTSERQDGGSGAYGRTGDQEERFWAAAELLKTTGDPRYDEYLQEELPYYFEKNTGIIGWGSGLPLGQFAYATSEQGDPKRKEGIRSLLVREADKMLRQIDSDGYRYALTSQEYTWASAKNGMAKAQILLLADELAANEAYKQAALEQVHYTLGRNALGTTYLTGSGDVMPMNPHSRMHIGTGTYIPGLLVGGPNKFGGDPELDQMLKVQAPAPAKAYLDISGSWASNEYAIDYNAPFVFVLSYFAK